MSGPIGSGGKVVSLSVPLGAPLGVQSHPGH